MFLDDYITKLQELRAKYGNVRVMKETHPYSDDWDDGDDIVDASKPTFAQLYVPKNNSEPLSVFNISNYDPNRISKTDETVILL